MSDRPPSPHSSGAHRLLVVDDDGHIREVLHYALTQAGHHVSLARDGVEALQKFETESFDLIVLDIIMPGLDGLDLCQRIRQKSSIPLLFVSSRDEELDRILGLELGADDYIAKPFSPRELVARVKAALRRADEIRALRGAADPSARSSRTHALLRHGRLVLDRVAHECSVGDRELILTVSEFSLLAALMERPTQVLSRSQLVERAYGPGHFLSDRTVDSHVRRIRGKLKSAGYDCLETVYGVGYKLTELE